MRKTSITIRLSKSERDVIERAAELRHASTGTWIRQLALKAAEEETDERRARRIERLAQQIENGAFGSPEHADEVERSRRKGWGRVERARRVGPKR